MELPPTDKVEQGKVELPPTDGIYYQTIYLSQGICRLTAFEKASIFLSRSFLYALHKALCLIFGFFSFPYGFCLFFI